TASPMARWSISPCTTSRSGEIPTIGTCLTLRIRPLLPGWRPYCMTRSWGYPPQKRPDPGRYGPLAARYVACKRGIVSKAFLRCRILGMGTSAMRKTETGFWTVQNTSLTRAMRLAAIALGVGLVMAAGPVRAGDDDEDDDRTFEEKIIHNLMTGIG